MTTQNTAGPFYVSSITDNRIDYDCSSIIADCRPQESQFLTLAMKARKEATKTTKCEWFDQSPVDNWTKINFVAGYTNETTFVVDDESKFTQYDIFKCLRTGEVFRVVSTNSGAHTVTVEARPFAGTRQDLINDDDLVVMGSAMAENSSKPTSKLYEPSPFYNRTQIFRTTFDASASMEAEAVKTTPQERIRLRKMKLFDHKIDIESAWWWGERVDGTSDHLRAMGGIIPRLVSNTWNVGGILTQKNMNAFLKDVFNNGSGSKALVASRTVIGAISDFAAGKLVISEDAKKFGLNIQTYMTPQGDELDLIPNRLFKNYYSGLGVILDMQYVFYRPLVGNGVNRDTKLKQNIQAADVDGWVDEYLTEATNQLRCEPAHGYFYGVTG